MSQFRRRLLMMMQTEKPPIHSVKCLVQPNNLAHIATDYLVTQNTNMKISYSYETVGFVFGSRNTGYNKRYNIYGNRPDYGYTGANILVPDDNGIYNVEFKNGQVLNNGMVVASGDVDNSVSDYPVYIFAINSDGIARACTANTKIYSIELYEGDMLAREFLPALDANGKACFYETVQRKYYYGNYDYGYEE